MGQSNQPSKIITPGSEQKAQGQVLQPNKKQVRIPPPQELAARAAMLGLMPAQSRFVGELIGMIGLLVKLLTQEKQQHDFTKRRLGQTTKSNSKHSAANAGKRRKPLPKNASKRQRSRLAGAGKPSS